MAWTWDVRRLMGLLSRVTLFLLFLGTPLYAWDSTGHAVVALLAESRLTPSAQATVAVLLGYEAGLHAATLSLRRPQDYSALGGRALQGGGEGR